MKRLSLFMATAALGAALVASGPQLAFGQSGSGGALGGGFGGSGSGAAAWAVAAALVAVAAAAV
jgi:hypothetical protein